MKEIKDIKLIIGGDLFFTLQNDDHMPPDRANISTFTFLWKDIYDKCGHIRTNTKDIKNET